MRKILITATILTVMALQPIMAYAQTTSTEEVTNTATQKIASIIDENGDEVDPGTLPDSPLYWLTNLIDKLQVALTFDPVKKAKLEEDQALEKLAAAPKLCEKGKNELAEECINDYYAKVEKAKEFLATVEDQNSEEAQNLLAAMENTKAKNIEALGVLLEKLPPQAAAKVALNIVRSMEKAVDQLSEEQQDSIQRHVENAAKKIEQQDLKEETKAALKEFKNSLQLKKTEREANKDNKDKESVSMEHRNNINQDTEKDSKISDDQDNERNGRNNDSNESEYLQRHGS